MKKLSSRILSIMKQGGVWVPSPLALDNRRKFSEKWQRLLTLYYIRSGSYAVIPGTHAGEFSGDNLTIYTRWLALIKEMTEQYGGKRMFLMAAAGGRHFMKQVEAACKQNYDIVMLAPTAFTRKSDREVVSLFRRIASMIPVFGFELQKAVPDSRDFSPYVWDGIFEYAYGAKGASFNTYKAQTMLAAAARSKRRNDLVLATGNDDRIVADLGSIFPFKTGSKTIHLSYTAGLLGHFATDTQAAVRWASAVIHARKHARWNLSVPANILAHLVSMCNAALFDAHGNFENSVWGIKHRLTRMGLLPGPYCFHESGRKGQAELINKTYNMHSIVNDSTYLNKNLKRLKKEAWQ